MKADYLAFARAASVALLGMVVQILLGLGLLIYGLLGQDHSAVSAAYLVLAGGVIWLALAIVFDQHRRERLENMEQESLAASSRTSVFETSADEHRIAARRLAWMHRILLPVISVTLGLVLIGIGIARLQSKLAPGALEVDKFAVPPLKGWAIALGLGIAVIGFVFARFISGMAKQTVWSNLRGGAGTIVGAAICGLAIAIAHFAHTAGTERVLIYLQVVIPGFMIILGAEMILNLLLNFYRPRRPGEVPRAAFDSRILSFVASPDRLAQSIGGAISYQFGVDVTGSWAYQLLSRSVGALVLIAAGVVWLLTCFEIVDPNERCIRTRFGAKVDEVGPGLYFKAPWPFEIFVSGSTAAQEQVDLMTPTARSRGPILWTNDHQVEEVYAIVQPTNLAVNTEREKAPNEAAKADTVRDIAIVAVEVPLIYAIRNLQEYEQFAAPEARASLIRSLAQRETMSYLATVTEDDLLGGRRPEISAELRRRIQARLDTVKAGVDVVVGCVEGVHPPQKEKAAQSFEDIILNQQKSLGEIERGRTEAIKILTEAVGSVELAHSIAREIESLNAITDEAVRAEQERTIEALIQKAGGQAAAMLARARSERWKTHMSERGRAEAYVAQLEAWRAAPAVYESTIYFSVLREIMKESRVYIVDDNPRYGLRIIQDLKDNEASSNPLTAPKETE